MTFKCFSNKCWTTTIIYLFLRALVVLGAQIILKGLSVRAQAKCMLLHLPRRGWCRARLTAVTASRTIKNVVLVADYIQNAVLVHDRIKDIDLVQWLIRSHWTSPLRQAFIAAPVIETSKINKSSLVTYVLYLISGVFPSYLLHLLEQMFNR